MPKPVTGQTFWGLFMRSCAYVLSFLLFSFSGGNAQAVAGTDLNFFNGKAQCVPKIFGSPSSASTDWYECWVKHTIHRFPFDLAETHRRTVIDERLLPVTVEHSVVRDNSKRCLDRFQCIHHEFTIFVFQFGEREERLVQSLAELDERELQFLIDSGLYSRDGLDALLALQGWIN